MRKNLPRRVQLSAAVEALADESKKRRTRTIRIRQLLGHEVECEWATVAAKQLLESHLQPSLAVVAIAHECVPFLNLPREDDGRLHDGDVDSERPILYEVVGALQRFDH